ncbi:MAG: hypothetical protein RMX99_007075 [Aulosira sp. DedVER01a]
MRSPLHSPSFAVKRSPSSASFLVLGDRLKYLTILVKAECAQLFLEVGRSRAAGAKNLLHRPAIELHRLAIQLPLQCIEALLLVARHRSSCSII